MIGPTRTPRLPEQPSNSKAEEFDHLSGDGLKIKKNINKDNLWIKGDGCRITFTTNNAKLRITGDGCRVHVGCNLGTIEYNGDGGHIILGPESSPDCSDRIVYKGDGGLIDFAGKKKYITKSNRNKETMTTQTSSSRSLSSRGDMRTKIVGSSNVQIHFNLRVHDKSS